MKTFVFLQNVVSRIAYITISVHTQFQAWIACVTNKTPNIFERYISSYQINIHQSKFPFQYIKQSFHLNQYFSQTTKHPTDQFIQTKYQNFNGSLHHDLSFKHLKSKLKTQPLLHNTNHVSVTRQPITIKTKQRNDTLCIQRHKIQSQAVLRV